MFIKYFLIGFISKSLASFDDMISRIPIIAYFTKTMKGRIAFSIGNILAVTAIIIITWFFSSLLEYVPHTHIIASILIFLMAIAVYFNVFGKKKDKKIKKQKEKIKIDISFEKFLKIISIGFIASFITLIDDFVVLAPLFLSTSKNQVYSIIGIYISTIIQLVLVIYLAKYLSRIKYIKEIATVGLLLLSIFVYFQGF